MSAARSVWLTYHEVHAGEHAKDVPRTAAAYHVSLDRFRRHLDAIRASGLPVVTVAESTAGEGAAAGDHVVLTFDDGWAGSLTIGVECLLEAGMRATFFVTRDFVGTPGFASRSQLVDARRAAMEIGTHGSTHRLLAELGRAEIDAELLEPKTFLEDLLAEPVTAGSVPGGSWSPAVARAAADAGYSSLCTSRPGINRAGADPFRVRRVTVRSGTRTETVERWARLSVADAMLRQGALAVPRRLLGERRYALLRRRLLGTAPEEDILSLGEGGGGRRSAAG